MGFKKTEVFRISAQEFAEQFDTRVAAAMALGVPRSTLFDMISRGDNLLVTPNEDREGSYSLIASIDTEKAAAIKDPGTVRIETHEKVKDNHSAELKKDLEQERYEKEALNLKYNSVLSDLRQAKKSRLVTEEVRKEILGLSERPMKPAYWLTSKEIKGSDPHSYVVGTPSITISDVHMGETVFPSQVNYLNEYNTDIARTRLREVTKRAIRMLTEYMVAPMGYPGIVVNLAGDLVAGDIHEELTATNDKPVMPCIIDMVNELIAMLNAFADKFGRVMVFSVPGNHGRTTKKVPSKNTNFTNYDWLISCFVERYFEGDDRVQFHVSDQPEIDYQLHNHRYRLTHGNEFRGGQGFVGALAPIIRGDRKKRISAASYGMEYDTLLLGHFHHLWMMGQRIANGSVVGFNEFAMSNDFEYDTPKQAMWITHPTYGITYTMPILCDPSREEPRETPWLSWT